jgi:hypothetical protein
MDAGGTNDDLTHFLHGRFEAAKVEQPDGLCGLVHLVDGVVHRRDQILDVAAIERGDESAPQRREHVARYLVGFVLARDDLLAMTHHLIAALSIARSASAPARVTSAWRAKSAKNRSSRGIRARNHPSMSVS